MRRKCAFVIAIITVTLFLSLIADSNAVCQQPDKPKRKKFGSSLKEPKPQSTLNQVKSTSTSDTSDDAIHLDTTMTVRDVLITDKAGHFVTGVTQDELIVREDGVEQQIGTFAKGDSVVVPKSIILIIDYSYSRFPFLDASLKAAQTLVSHLQPNDQMAIVTDDVELVCDYTNDKSKLVKALNSIRTRIRYGNRGKSLQFSALTATLRELIDADHLRPYIIFQTHGDEIARMTDQEKLRKEIYTDVQMKAIRNSISKISFKEVVQTIEETPGTIYTIIPDDKWISDNPKEYRELGGQLSDQLIAGDKRTLRYRQGISEAMEQREAHRIQAGQYAASVVARITGAWTSFLRNPEDAEEIYDHIWQNINNRYFVGYYPKNTAKDGKKREVRIEVRGHPEYVVLGRTTYIPSEND